jgi:hypothetical protein
VRAAAPPVTAGWLEGLPVGNLAAGGRHDHERLGARSSARRQELQLAAYPFTVCE